MKILLLHAPGSLSSPRGEQWPPCVLTIGDFDGCHQGHQRLLERAKAEAQQAGWLFCVMSFEPSPKLFFKRPQQAPGTPVNERRIQSFADKMRTFQAYGVDCVWIVRFNAAFAALSPEQFFQDYLQAHNVSMLVVGEDFRFGAGRAGSARSLSEAATAQGMGCCILSDYRAMAKDPALLGAPEGALEQKRVSSRWLAQALESGDFQTAQVLLGRPYQISGKVRSGAQKGRLMGFPTMNIYIGAPLVLSGVYCAFVRLEQGGRAYIAVLNIGQRPTLYRQQGSRPVPVILEIHFLQECPEADYLFVEPCLKIREEKKFPSLTALQGQIASDVQVAKDFFSVYDASGG